MGYVGPSDYLLDKELKNRHGEAQFTMPAATYLSAWIGNPLSTGSEATGGSYARQSVTWSGVTSGTNKYTDTNSAAIEFPEATADWGIITHVATYDALSSGNMLEVFELSASRNIVSGIVLRVAASELDSTHRRVSI